MRGDLGDRADLDDPAGVEDRDAIGERVGVDGIVGDEHAHPVERLEVPSQVAADAASGAGVERGERLVEQQQPRVGRQRPRECDALRLTARQRPWPV